MLPNRMIFLFYCLILINGNIFFAQTNFQDAIKLFEKNKFEEANEVLEKLIDQNDDDPDIHFYLGRTNLSLKDFGEASDNFEDAVELDDNNATYHFWLAQAYAGDAQSSNFISAAFIAPKIKDEYARTIEIDPTHLGGHIGLANFHLNAPGIVGGDLEEAYTVGKKLLSLDEQKGRMTLINYFVKKEFFDSIKIQLAIVEEKIENDKSLATFYNSYGYSLIGRKQFDEAIIYFKKQVKLTPEDANSYDSLGDGFRSAGKLNEAVIQYKKALEIDPNFEASKENLEEVVEELESLE